MKRFGLQWIGKSSSTKLAERSPQSSLQLSASSRVQDTKGELADNTHELIIGENLEALKVLRESEVRVDVIYIDPPYNTGKDFLYSDHAQPDLSEADYSDLTSKERSHCAWLSMMRSRLLVSHDLLEDRGSVWVSIDDHELAHLLLLMNEIFGEENHIATLITSLNPKGRQLGRFAVNHEYLLVFAKSLPHCDMKYATQEAVNPKDFRHQDDQGRFRYLPLRNSNKRFNPSTRPTLYYPLYVHPDTREVSADPQPEWIEVSPVFGSGEPAVWRWSKQKVSALGHTLEGSVINGRLGARWDVRQKDYNSEERTKKLKTVWRSDEVGSTDEAAREVKELGLALFETPKPTRLLKRILALTPPDAVVLDFFAGSGTTGEAIINQNLSDGGERRFILIQSSNPIDDERFAHISDITRERLALVSQRSPKAAPIRIWTLSPH